MVTRREAESSFVTAHLFETDDASHAILCPSIDSACKRGEASRPTPTPLPSFPRALALLCRSDVSVTPLRISAVICINIPRPRSITPSRGPSEATIRRLNQAALPDVQRTLDVASPSGLPASSPASRLVESSRRARACARVSATSAPTRYDSQNIV